MKYHRKPIKRCWILLLTCQVGVGFIDETLMLMCQAFDKVKCSSGTLFGSSCAMNHDQ